MMININSIKTNVLIRDLSIWLNLEKLSLCCGLLEIKYIFVDCFRPINFITIDPYYNTTVLHTNMFSFLARQMNIPDSYREMFLGDKRRFIISCIDSLLFTKYIKSLYWCFNKKTIERALFSFGSFQEKFLNKDQDNRNKVFFFASKFSEDRVASRLAHLFSLSNKSITVSSKQAVWIKNEQESSKYILDRSIIGTRKLVTCGAIVSIVFNEDYKGEINACVRFVMEKRHKINQILYQSINFIEIIMKNKKMLGVVLNYSVIGYCYFNAKKDDNYESIKIKV